MPRRKFGVLDGMVLIAATAPALAYLRGEPWIVLDTSDKLTVSNRLLQIRHWLTLLAYLFASWSIALLILRWRKPRPATRRLARQPGMSACIATVIVLGITLMNMTLLALVSTFPRIPSSWAFWIRIFERFRVEDFPFVPSAIGETIAAAWVIQALGGRWRPEPSWIDRLGRGFAAFWIATIPFAWFDYLFDG